MRESMVLNPHRWALALLSLTLAILIPFAWLTDVRPAIRAVKAQAQGKDVNGAAKSLAEALQHFSQLTESLADKQTGVPAVLSSLNDKKHGIREVLYNVDALTAQATRTTNVARVTSVDEQAWLVGGKDSKGVEHTGVMAGIQELVTSTSARLNGPDGTLPALTSDLNALHVTLGRVGELVGLGCEVIPGTNARPCSPTGLQSLVASGTRTIDSVNLFVSDPEWAKTRSNLASMTEYGSLTLQHVSEITDLGYKYLYDWGHPAKLPFWKNVGRNVLLPLAERAVPGIAQAAFSHWYPIVVQTEATVKVKQ